MQITINIPENLPIERVRQVIDELAGKLELPLDLINIKPEVLESESDLKGKLAAWQRLFKTTQNLPNLKAISEANINAKIDAYRSGL